MGTIASQITSLSVVYSTVYPDADQRKHQSIKAPRHWPLCGEFTGTGEFPAQRASNAAKCFHLMTSSWNAVLSHFVLPWWYHQPPKYINDQFTQILQLLHWHWGNRYGMTAPVLVKLPWKIWVKLPHDAKIMSIKFPFLVTYSYRNKAHSINHIIYHQSSQHSNFYAPFPGISTSNTLIIAHLKRGVAWFIVGWYFKSIEIFCLSPPISSSR